MSLAAFSVLIVAFICLTGEAHVVPKNSENKSSLPFPETTLETPYSSQSTFTTYNQEDSRIPEFKVPRLTLSPPEGSWIDISTAEWSDTVLAKWCDGDEDGDYEDQMDGERGAKMRLRNMLCQPQSSSIAHTETLEMQTP